MKVEQRLVYPDSVRGPAIKLDGVVSEPKVMSISQVAKTKQHDVRPPWGAEEFVSPTAAELFRLMYPTRVIPISEEMNQGAGSFASLLNRGSSLE